ncbi:Phosphoglycerate mutase-like protein [Drosera capensis]
MSGRPNRDDMDSSGAGIGLFPLHRSKTIHLVRHAQGFHNVAGEKDHDAYLSYDYLDATLTPLGWEQVDNLRKYVRETGLFKKIELVITSPLRRTMQTAAGAFGGGEYVNGIDVPPLMVENAGNSGRPAISSLNCPPFLANELCREQMIETDEDTLWREDVRETTEDVAARGLKFMTWLLTRKEKEIVVVSHSSFLFNTLNQFGNDCHPLVKSEFSTHFANCELRSVVIVDRGMIGLGSDPSATNFLGKIPSGAALPCDKASKN